MDLKSLSALLMVYSHNFHMLHWLASGEEFHTQHDKAFEYYEKLSEDVDYIVEASMRHDEFPVGYQEAYELLESGDKSYKVIKAEGLTNLSTFVDETDLLFTDILEAIEELLEDDLIKNVKNSGIRSQLETMHDYYDLQLRYINKQRR